MVANITPGAGAVGAFPQDEAVGGYVDLTIPRSRTGQ